MESQNSKMHMKKFNTRGEEFLNYLQSLGYQPPKHQKGEHFDYIFQDEELSRKVKAIMTKIKPHNIMGTEEIQSFQLLKDDGMVMYGKDLEDAVEREKSMDRKIAEDICAANAKEAEWNILIESKKSNIEKLNALSDILTKTIEEQQTQDARKKQLITKWEMENISLNKAIQIDRKMLMEKLDELQNTLENIIAPTALKNEENSLLDVDWTRVIEDEDVLMNMIKPMVETYGTDLIRKSEQDDGAGDFESEGIQKIFLQYEKDFERLKHSIIYEKVKDAGHDNILLAGETAACAKLEDCLQEIERLSQIDDAAVLNKMKSEVHRDTDKLEEALNIERERAISHVKNLVISELNDDIKELVDLKAQAKRNLQEFLEFVVEILSEQKVRVDLIREFSRTEGRGVDKLAQQLNRQKKRLSTLHQKQELICEGITEDKLSEDGHRLFEVFSKYGVPLSVLESHTNTMVSLNAIQNQVTLDKLKKRQTNHQHLQSISQKMVAKQNAIKDIFEKIRVEYIEGEEEKLIQELEKTHKIMEEKLHWHSDHKQEIVRESINKKWAAMKKIQMALRKQNPSDS